MQEEASKKIILSGVDQEIYNSLTSEEKEIVDSIGIKKINDSLLKNNAPLTAKDVAALFVARRQMKNGDEMDVTPELRELLKQYEPFLQF